MLGHPPHGYGYGYESQDMIQWIRKWTWKITWIRTTDMDFRTWNGQGAVSCTPGSRIFRNKNRIRKYLKGVCHKIFDLNLFYDLNPSGPLINTVFSNLVSISPRYSIKNFEKFNSAVCMTPRLSYILLMSPHAVCESQTQLRSKHFRLSKSKFVSSNLCFHDRYVQP